MAFPKDPLTGLTRQQEAFAQAVASGSSYTDAYRQAYNVSPSAVPTGVWVDASRIAAHPNVMLRVQQLRQTAQLQAEKLLAKKRGWTLERLADEAETNLAGSRNAKQWASANGALELIGRATGLLSDKGPAAAPVAITRVVVVLDHGADAEGQPRVVEADYQLRAIEPVPSDETPALTPGSDGDNPP